jgi:mono/diheme cytochrome c family protein
MNRFSQSRHLVVIALVVIGVVTYATCRPPLDRSPLQLSSTEMARKLELTQRAGEAKTLDDRVETGRQIYRYTCLRCHQHEGQGKEGAVPPLFGSDFVNHNLDGVIRIVSHGAAGPLRVNDRVYFQEMPDLGLTSAEVACVVTFVTSSWHNLRVDVAPEDVERVNAAPILPSKQP